MTQIVNRPNHTAHDSFDAPTSKRQPLPGQRSRGALLGLAVGDALGAPMRGRNLLAPLFPQLADGMRRMPTKPGSASMRASQARSCGYGCNDTPPSGACAV